MNEPASKMTPKPEQPSGDTVEVSVVMPCLNEAETIEICVRKALGCFEQHGLKGEVVVADNGSDDGSQALAEKAGARVVQVPTKGYGAALMGGFKAAKGTILMMGDADDSYDFTGLMPFVEKIREGYDVVMGNRFAGGISPGAMPWHHKYIGNPVLTGVLNLLYRTGIRDAHCGLRALTKETFDRLNLRTTGMEFASEMVVKASLQGLKMTEVPTTLSPDGRSRPPHLRSFRDGWRHLRFLMLLAPGWVLMAPGCLLMTLGALMLASLLAGSRFVVELGSSANLAVASTLMILAGYQGCAMGLAAQLYVLHQEIGPASRAVRWFGDWFRLERGLIVGGMVTVAGLVVLIVRLMDEAGPPVDSVAEDQIARSVVLGLTLAAMGLSTMFWSTFFGMLAMCKNRQPH